jgi:flagellar motor switch protein FliN
MSNIAQEQASVLVQHFAEAASSVLSQVSGTALQAQPSLLDTATEAATLIRIAISGALEGVCEIALSAPMTAQFAALLTGETPDPAAEISADLREAAAELMQQICGNAADRLRRAFGPLELKPQPSERDSESGARHIFLVARDPVSSDQDALNFEFHIVRLAGHSEPVAAAPAIQATAPLPSSLSSSSAELQAATHTASSAISSAASAAQSNNRNLDLLLDIELGATLRFGTRQMLLKDILELCSGSVVELDRRVEEPVDLLIDGRLIAKGEVVIVAGNYGLRILQVASQSEKIACLP